MIQTLICQLIIFIKYCWCWPTPTSALTLGYFTTISEMFILLCLWAATSYPCNCYWNPRDSPTLTNGFSVSPLQPQPTLAPADTSSPQLLDLSPILPPLLLVYFCHPLVPTITSSQSSCPHPGWQTLPHPCSALSCFFIHLLVTPHQVKLVVQPHWVLQPLYFYVLVCLSEPSWFHFLFSQSFHWYTSTLCNSWPLSSGP